MVLDSSASLADNHSTQSNPSCETRSPMMSQCAWRRSGCSAHCASAWAAAGSLSPQARLCEQLQLSSFLPALPSINFCPCLDAQLAAGLKWGTQGSVLGPCSPYSSEGWMRRQVHPCLAGEAKLGEMGVQQMAEPQSRWTPRNSNFGSTETLWTSTRWAR